MLRCLLLPLSIDLSEVVDMLLLLPSCPDEVTVSCKALFAAVLPPVALLKHTLHDWVVVAGAYKELLRLVHILLVLGCLASC